MAARKNGSAITTLADLAREMRSEFATAEKKAERRNAEVLGAIAKMHGLEERMSRIEREFAEYRRKRGEPVRICVSRRAAQRRGPLSAAQEQLLNDTLRPKLVPVRREPHKRYPGAERSEHVDHHRSHRVRGGIGTSPATIR